MRYAGFLRAVNVGGTGRLPMSDLISICADAGFEDAQTYIASGNVAFSSDASEAQVKRGLEVRLEEYAGKPVPVFVRNAPELARVLNANPFADCEPKFTVAVFLDSPPDEDLLELASGRKDEEMQLRAREIYVHYPQGIGSSKLKIPAAATGTARNMNTVAKLVSMTAEPSCDSGA